MSTKETPTPETTEENVVEGTVEETSLRSATATTTGINVETHGANVLIDDVVNGIIAWGIHNYRSQVKANIAYEEPDVSKAQTGKEAEGIIKVTEEINAEKLKQQEENIKKQFIFKVKAMTYMAFRNIIGEFDEVAFNNEIHEEEVKALAAIEDTETPEVLEDKPKKKAKKKAKKKDD